MMKSSSLGKDRKLENNIIENIGNLFTIKRNK